MRYQVKNTGTEPYTGQFDGIKLTLAPGETKVISESFARHCFAAGLGEAEKLAVIARNGWAATSGEIAKAMKRLDQFALTPVEDGDPAVAAAPVQPPPQEPGLTPPSDPGLGSGVDAVNGPEDHEAQ